MRFGVVMKQTNCSLSPERPHAVRKRRLSSVRLHAMKRGRGPNFKVRWPQDACFETPGGTVS